MFRNPKSTASPPPSSVFKPDPGHAHLVFLLLASTLGWPAWDIAQKKSGWWKPRCRSLCHRCRKRSKPAERCRTVDVLAGSRLSPDSAGGQVAGWRAAASHSRHPQEICAGGRFPASPPVHIRDNLELKPNTYRILLKVETAWARPLPANIWRSTRVKCCALNGVNSRSALACRRPGSMPANATRRRLMATVVDASTVVATHLNHLILTHAAELPAVRKCSNCSIIWPRKCPSWSRIWCPRWCRSNPQKVLQGMLEEGVHIRDMRTIIETVADHATRTRMPTILVFRCARLSAVPLFSNFLPGVAFCARVA